MLTACSFSRSAGAPRRFDARRRRQGHGSSHPRRPPVPLQLKKRALLWPSRLLRFACLLPVSLRARWARRAAPVRPPSLCSLPLFPSPGLLPRDVDTHALDCSERRLMSSCAGGSARGRKDRTSNPLAGPSVHSGLHSEAIVVVCKASMQRQERADGTPTRRLGAARTAALATRLDPGPSPVSTHPSRRTAACARRPRHLHTRPSWARSQVQQPCAKTRAPSRIGQRSHRTSTKVNLNRHGHGRRAGARSAAGVQVPNLWRRRARCARPTKSRTRRRLRTGHRG